MSWRGKRGFRLGVAARPGEWGPDRPKGAERFPDRMEGFDDPFEPRDLAPPCRDSSGHWLLDGGQWQALRALEMHPELESARYAEPAREMKTRPPASHVGSNAAARSALAELARLSSRHRATRPW